MTSSQLQLDALSIFSMANGHPALLLSERVNWEAFPRYAEALMASVGGRIDERTDSVVQRVYHVDIQGKPFALAFDDFPFETILVPRNGEAEAALESLLDRLAAVRSPALNDRGHR